MPAQNAPSVPDISSLKDLSAPVQVLFLVVVLAALVLFYFGASIKDKISRKPPDPPATAVASTAAPAATPAIDRASTITDDYIGDLRAQIAELKARVVDLERERDVLRNDLDRLRLQSFYPPPRRTDG